MENNNNEVSLTDSNTESQSKIEISGTESIIMDNVANQSTPIQSKKSSDEHNIKSNTVTESTPIITNN